MVTKTITEQRAEVRIFAGNDPAHTATGSSGISSPTPALTPLMLDETVGIVKQPHRGCQMPSRPMGIGRRLELSGQQRPDNLVEKIAFLHHSTLYLSKLEAAKAVPKAITSPMM